MIIRTGVPPRSAYPQVIGTAELMSVIENASYCQQDMFPWFNTGINHRTAELYM